MARHVRVGSGVSDAGLVITLLGTSGASAQQGRTSTDVKDTAGRVVGRVTLTEGSDGVQVSGSFQALPPGEHAVQIATVGQCETPQPAGEDRRSLPNLRIVANGTGAMSVVTKGTT